MDHANAHERHTDRLRCHACGEVIGVYEPLVAIVDGDSPVTGSRLTLAELLAADQRPPCYHARCYAPDMTGSTT